MAEILAVTWGEEELALRRVASEGTWNKNSKVLKRVPIQRPTRAGRLSHPEIGGALGTAMTELFIDVDINVPCWLLLPNDWILRFVSEPPDLKNQELTLNHLRWEAAQRISGDPADFKISAALMMGGTRYYICLIRSEVIQRCLTAADSADLELAGIGIEPDANETYTFEHPLDLRDALPLEIEHDGNSAKSIATRKASPAVVGIFLGIVIILAGYLYFSSQPAPVKKPSAERSTKKSMTPQEAATPPEALLSTSSADSSAPHPGINATVTETPPISTPEVKSKPATTIEKAEPAPTKGESAPANLTVSGKVSPIRGLFAGLSGNAKAALVVLSPVDLKVEASGIANPDQWLAELKKQAGWSTAKLTGSYETVGGKVTTLRVESPGWKVTEGKPSAKWQELAKSAGLSVKDRSASGKLEGALAFLDQIWQNSNGISKVYLTPQGDSWQIVIQ